MALPLRKQEVEEVLVSGRTGRIVLAPRPASPAQEEGGSSPRVKEEKEILPQTFG